jgi:protoporphyrinogen oxidase
VDDRGDVVILGAGLTGLSCALHLSGPCLVLEREGRVGGKACTDRRDGFIFDITGHWLHLRDARTKALVADLFGPGDLVEIERRTGVFTHGVMLAYPFQANLFGLPLPVVHECLLGLFEAGRRTDELGAEASLQAFAERRFGAGIARHFFVPYNTKLWGVAPDKLASAWVTRYVPVPEPSQILAGAIGLRQDGLGYNARFLYPKEGGIDALARALATRLEGRGDVPVHVGAEVAAVDLAARTVRLADGRVLPWGRLVSTIPLPALIDRIEAVPPRVREARAALRWIRWRYLNIATRTPSPIPEHWVYVPEPEFPFFRVGIFTNASPAMAPPSCGGLYVELTDREGEPDMPAILAGLTTIGAITGPEDVLFTEQHDIEYAYVVFDEAHAAATATIHAWLAEHGVHSCGRYGAWVYSSMEDALLDGMEAAAWVRQ